MTTTGSSDMASLRINDRTDTGIAIESGIQTGDGNHAGQDENNTYHSKVTQLPFQQQAAATAAHGTEAHSLSASGLSLRKAVVAGLQERDNRRATLANSSDAQSAGPSELKVLYHSPSHITGHPANDPDSHGRWQQAEATAVHRHGTGAHSPGSASGLSLRKAVAVGLQKRDTRRARPLSSAGSTSPNSAILPAMETKMPVARPTMSRVLNRHNAKPLATSRPRLSLLKAAVAGAREQKNRRAGLASSSDANLSSTVDSPEGSSKTPEEITTAQTKLVPEIPEKEKPESEFPAHGQQSIQTAAPTIAEPQVGEFMVNQQPLPSNEFWPTNPFLPPVIQRLPINPFPHAPYPCPFGFAPRCFTPAISGTPNLPLPSPPPAAMDEIPDNLNCSFRMTQLPPTVTHRDVFDAIQGAGRVFALDMLSENAWSTPTFWIQFFSAQAAQTFWTRFGPDTRGLPVRGAWARVAHQTGHRRSTEQTLPRDHSRIVNVVGMDRDELETLLAKRIDGARIEQMHEMKSNKGTGNLVVVHFSQYLEGAAVAYAVVSELERKGVVVEFGEDPCGAA